MVKKLCISVSDAEFALIKELHLSPSEIMQDALKFLDTENMQLMVQTHKRNRESLKRLTTFISNKNLQEDYSKYVLENKDNQ